MALGVAGAHADRGPLLEATSAECISGPKTVSNESGSDRRRRGAPSGQASRSSRPGDLGGPVVGRPASSLGLDAAPPASVGHGLLGVVAGERGRGGGGLVGLVRVGRLVVGEERVELGLGSARRRLAVADARDRRGEGEAGGLVGRPDAALLEERVVLGCRLPRSPRRRAPRGPPGDPAPCGRRRWPARPSRPG